MNGIMPGNLIITLLAHVVCIGLELKMDLINKEKLNRETDNLSNYFKSGNYTYAEAIAIICIYLDYLTMEPKYPILGMARTGEI